MLPYSASKFALAGFTEGLRSELAKDNILVTGIYPATIRTGGHAHAQFKGDRHAEYTWFALSDVIPGVATSAESAARILWDAVTHGDPEALVGWSAHAMRLAHGLFPNWTAEAFALLNQALPRASGAGGGALRGDQLEGPIPDALNRIAPSGTRPRAV
jgi:short-subunit dehydrogenase